MWPLDFLVLKVKILFSDQLLDFNSCNWGCSIFPPTLCLLSTLGSLHSLRLPKEITET